MILDLKGKNTPHGANPFPEGLKTDLKVRRADTWQGLTYPESVFIPLKYILSDNALK